MKRSDSLQELVTGFRQGLARKTGDLVGAGKLTEAQSALEELEFKLRVAEMALQFYADMPDTKKFLLDAALPPELKALLKKGRP
jgi:hypothetical protein